MDDQWAKRTNEVAQKSTEVSLEAPFRARCKNQLEAPSADAQIFFEAYQDLIERVRRRGEAGDVLA